MRVASVRTAVQTPSASCASSSSSPSSKRTRTDGGQRLEHAHAQAAGLEVLAEEVVGLLVAALDEGRDRTADLGAGGGAHDGSP